MLPADAETERLARKLAEATGKSLPTVVIEAIAAQAEAAGLNRTSETRPTRDELLARMTAITEGFASLPVLDARIADAIIGYDEHGVPR